MERNLDLIRDILLALESRSTYSTPEKIAIEGYTHEEVDYHCRLLTDAGYIISTSGGYNCFPIRMTDSGHDFLDASRDAGIWKKTKDFIASKGVTVPLEIAKSLALEYLKKKLGMSN